MQADQDLAAAFENGRRKGRQEGMAIGAGAMTAFLIVLLLLQR
jgi:threonine/homoserine/homoserine lactone efflux protein